MIPPATYEAQLKTLEKLTDQYVEDSRDAWEDTPEFEQQVEAVLRGEIIEPVAKKVVETAKTEVEWPKPGHRPFWFIVRDWTLIFCGLSIILAFVIGLVDEPTLLMLAAAMVGLPAMMPRTISKPSPDDSKGRRGNDGYFHSDHHVFAGTRRWWACTECYEAYEGHLHQHCPHCHTKDRIQPAHPPTTTSLLGETQAETRRRYGLPATRD